MRKLQEDGSPGGLSYAAPVCECGKWYENPDSEITQRVAYFSKLRDSIHRMVILSPQS